MKNLLILLLLLPLFLISQDNKTEKKNAKENIKLENTDTLTADKPQINIYKTGDRRDPFVSLLRDIIAKDTKNAPPPGLAGLMIEEIKLDGIMYFKKVYHANFVGPDNKAYLITKGERLYDGEIIDIGIDSVTFRKELTTRIAGKKEKVIVIKLNPGDLNSQGGRRK